MQEMNRQFSWLAVKNPHLVFKGTVRLQLIVTFYSNRHFNRLTARFSLSFAQDIITALFVFHFGLWGFEFKGIFVILAVEKKNKFRQPDLANHETVSRFLNCFIHFSKVKTSDIDLTEVMFSAARNLAREFRPKTCTCSRLMKMFHVARSAGILYRIVAQPMA